MSTCNSSTLRAAATVTAWACHLQARPSRTHTISPIFAGLAGPHAQLSLVVADDVIDRARKVGDVVVIEARHGDASIIEQEAGVLALHCLLHSKNSGVWAVGG